LIPGIVDNKFVFHIDFRAFASLSRLDILFFGL
jgi:hypothetical protein